MPRPARRVAASAANLLAALLNGRPLRRASSRGDALAEFGMGVQPGADGGAADRQFDTAAESAAMQIDSACSQLRDVTGEFLAQRQRRGVLQMGAADLDDIREGGGFLLQCPVQNAQRR